MSSDSADPNLFQIAKPIHFVFLIALVVHKDPLEHAGVRDAGSTSWAVNCSHPTSCCPGGAYPLCPAIPQHLPQGDRSLQSQGEDCHLLSPQSWLWGHLTVPLRFPSWHTAGGEDLRIPWIWSFHKQHQSLALYLYLDALSLDSRTSGWVCSMQCFLLRKNHLPKHPKDVSLYYLFIAWGSPRSSWKLLLLGTAKLSLVPVHSVGKYGVSEHSVNFYR